MNFLSVVLADQTLNIVPPAAASGVTGANLSNWITWAITLVIILAGIIFFFMLIIGGVKWILSGGDKANTESARNQITAALIGLIIVFAAWAIITLISNVFGFDILNLSIPSLTQVGSDTIRL